MAKTSASPTGRVSTATIASSPAGSGRPAARKANAPNAAARKNASL